MHFAVKNGGKYYLPQTTHARTADLQQCAPLVGWSEKLGRNGRWNWKNNYICFTIALHIDNIQKTILL